MMTEKENSTIKSLKELENDYKLILSITHRINQDLVEKKVDQIIDLLSKRQELISKVDSFHGELFKLQEINLEQKELNQLEITNIDEIKLIKNCIRKILLEIMKIDEINTEYGTQIKEAIKLELSRLRSATRFRQEYIKYYNLNEPRIIDENK